MSSRLETSNPYEWPCQIETRSSNFVDQYVAKNFTETRALNSAKVVLQYFNRDAILEIKDASAQVAQFADVFDVILTVGRSRIISNVLLQMNRVDPRKIYKILPEINDAIFKNHDPREVPLQDLVPTLTNCLKSLRIKIGIEPYPNICLVEDRARNAKKLGHYYELLSLIKGVGNIAVAAFATEAYNNPISSTIMQKRGLNDTNCFIPIRSPSILGEEPLPSYALLDALSDLSSAIAPERNIIDGNLSPEILHSLKRILKSALKQIFFINQ